MEEENGQEKEVKLTAKQLRFVEEYCIDFNATRAANVAGYSAKTAYSIGHENLRKPEIKKFISAKLNHLTMSAEEAMVRLTDFGRGSFQPFLLVDENNDITLDLTSDEAQKNIHYIKKVKQTKKVFAGLTETVTQVEIHDAKDAVVKMLQVHGKLIDKQEVNHLNDGGKFEEKTLIVFGKGTKDGDSTQ